MVWIGSQQVSTTSDYLAIGVKNGFLHLRYNLGSGEIVIVENSTKVDDGKWHNAQIRR